jgi:hypothetical protein
MAGALGFEPRMAVPKTAALPLGYAPIFFNYNVLVSVVQNFNLCFLMIFFTFKSDFLFFAITKKADPLPVIE